VTEVAVSSLPAQEPCPVIGVQANEPHRPALLDLCVHHPPGGVRIRATTDWLSVNELLVCFNMLLVEEPGEITHA
jgi:hypothetical protein